MGERNWKTGKIVWISEKIEKNRTKSYEVVYELDDDPDLLKEVLVDEAAIYENARKGDRIRIATEPTVRVVRESEFQLG